MHLQGWKENGLLRRCEAQHNDGPCPTSAYILEFNREDKKEFEIACAVSDKLTGCFGHVADPLCACRFAFAIQGRRLLAKLPVM